MIGARENTNMKILNYCARKSSVLALERHAPDRHQKNAALERHNKILAYINH